MNNQLPYICDRIQKITEAVYRITELLHDKEPMKWEIREKTISIFTSLFSLKKDGLWDKNKEIENIENLIDQVVVLLSLFSETRAISSVNFEILRDEYELVKKVINKQKQSRDFVKLCLEESRPLESSASGQSLEKSALAQNLENSVSNQGLKNSVSDQGQDIKKEMLEMPLQKEEVEESPIRHNIEFKGHKEYKGQSNIYKGHSKGQIKPIELIRNKTRKEDGKTKTRKDKILGIIKNKREVSIGELSESFNGCSNKTIQRDLSQMVNKGILKKEGERRWTRYMIA